MADVRLIRWGYAVAAVIWVDQLSQVAAGFPFDPTLALARFQVANLIAPRLVLFVLANVLLLVVGTVLGTRVVRWLALAAQGLVGVVAVVVTKTVLDDGAYMLATFGPPGGQLAQFQAVRLNSLVASVLTVAIVAVHAVVAVSPGRRSDPPSGASVTGFRPA